MTASTKVLSCDLALFLASLTHSPVVAERLYGAFFIHTLVYSANLV